MESYDFVKMINLLSKLLYGLPNMSTGQAIMKILEAADSKLNSGDSKTLESSNAPLLKGHQCEVYPEQWEKTIALIRDMGSREVREFILQHKDLNTVKSLMELAKHLNIAINGRQKKETIIHTICKSLERDRVDQTIRSRSKSPESHDGGA